VAHNAPSELRVFVDVGESVVGRNIPSVLMGHLKSHMLSTSELREKIATCKLCPCIKVVNPFYHHKNDRHQKIPVSHMP
jgi:hypothetical protein